MPLLSYAELSNSIADEVKRDEYSERHSDKVEPFWFNKSHTSVETASPCMISGV